jgi:hypothetical protein
LIHLLLTPRDEEVVDPGGSPSTLSLLRTNIDRQ